MAPAYVRFRHRLYFCPLTFAKCSDKARGKIGASGREVLGVHVGVPLKHIEREILVMANDQFTQIKCTRISGSR